MRDLVERSLRFPEARVHVRAFGEGPPLLLINGLGAHTAMWEPLEKVLAGFRIVEFDLPGAGRSDVPWRPVSIKRLASLAVSVMNKFEMEEPDVLGYSMGGWSPSSSPRTSRVECAGSSSPPRRRVRAPCRGALRRCSTS